MFFMTPRFPESKHYYLFIKDKIFVLFLVLYTVFSAAVRTFVNSID